MGLPSNASAIRSNIVDTFKCDNRIYGYYADVDNDCQVFHICYPVVLADDTNQMFKWSFICPEETIFNQVFSARTISLFQFNCDVLTNWLTSQESMTCAFPTDAIPCSESPNFYNLNQNFGVIPSTTTPAL